MDEIRDRKVRFISGSDTSRIMTLERGGRKVKEVSSHKKASRAVSNKSEGEGSTPTTSGKGRKFIYLFLCYVCSANIFMAKRQGLARTHKTTMTTKQWKWKRVEKVFITQAKTFILRVFIIYLTAEDIIGLLLFFTGFCLFAVVIVFSTLIKLLDTSVKVSYRRKKLIPEK